MSEQIISSELLTELSIEEQEVLAGGHGWYGGGHGHGGWGHGHGGWGHHRRHGWGHHRRPYYGGWY